uniref:SMB domain-containing protein n=1 Tax=Periophthalmus magnuspinnatus TaxID=409849 RepID=A0A3B4BCA5_9GOBI
MRLLALLLLLPLQNCLLESCMDRCENGFDSAKKCQCDSMCKYYKSCCSDYESTLFLISGTKPSRQEIPTEPSIMDFNPRHTHEGTIEMTKPQKEDKDTEATANDTSADSTIAPPTAVPSTTASPTTAPPDPDAEVCSERPFDSFMQLKNGSIYAFRGEYFFVLDQKSVLPGYPKLIKDVWGINGPIDAAFTRMNCQGKTYIFKGNKYWRFDNGVLDEDYPRDISVGFDKIPDYVDAAFALPAPGHNGKEKVFFFKGDQYYVYEFVHQPSHEECIGMSERSPSTIFRRYTDVYYGNYEHFFSELFSDLPQHHDHHHFIDKDWKGLKSPVDAAMAGRIYVTPLRFTPVRNDDRQQWNQYSQQWSQQYGWGRRRQNRSPYWETMAERGMNMGQDLAQRGWDQDWDQDQRWDRYNSNNRGNYDSRNSRGNSRPWNPLQKTQPIQTVYFFKADKYYRVDLRSKRVDPAMPPYPRSIAKYWLGCSGTTGAEK